MRYIVALALVKFGPNSQFSRKVIFFGKFKCYIYLSVVTHYATKRFANINRVDHEDIKLHKFGAL